MIISLSTFRTYEASVLPTRPPSAAIFIISSTRSCKFRLIPAVNPMVVLLWIMKSVPVTVWTILIRTAVVLAIRVGRTLLSVFGSMEGILLSDLVPWMAILRLLRWVVGDRKTSHLSSDRLHSYLLWADGEVYFVHVLILQFRMKSDLFLVYWFLVWRWKQLLSKGSVINNRRTTPIRLEGLFCSNKTTSLEGVLFRVAITSQQGVVEGGSASQHARLVTEWWRWMMSNIFSCVCNRWHVSLCPLQRDFLADIFRFPLKFVLSLSWSTSSCWWYQGILRLCWSRKYIFECSLMQPG